MTELAQLISHSGMWEHERGIKNPNYGAYRTGDELIEFETETDPFLKLMEAVDIMIVLWGGVDKLLKEQGMCPEQFESLVEQKFDINDRKYQLKYFREMPVEKAIEYSRFIWAFDQPEWTEDWTSDIY